jgi:molybdopterin-binding protein
VISLQGVNASVGNFQLVDIDIDVHQGGYGVVIGPAGSGKTTLLETIAGALRPTSGRIVVAGLDVTTMAPEHRRLGIVYQHAYLFPHLTVRENVAYGALSIGAAADVSRRFELDALADRSVTSLSGGERQLVALARALARQPDVLLLDEPFSALDPRTRDRARRLLSALYQERRFTVLQVTHDFSEAGTLGDVAIVMSAGRVLQQGNPEIVFRKPITPYIADFLGAENVFAGTVHLVAQEKADLAPDVAGKMDEHAVAFTTGALTFYAVGDAPAGPAHAVIRAEEIALSTTHKAAPASSVQNHCAGRVIEILNAGPLARVAVDAGGTTIVATVTTRSVRELDLHIGTDVVASFKTTAVHLC